jgi:hypothetical protein
MVDMPGDHDLDLRGRLIRSLGALREMLPGSFVERHRKCGKPNCRCADGKQLHSEFQVSVLLGGKLKTFHIPAELAEEARRKVEMHKRFQAAAATIGHINLRRFLQRKGEKEKR